MSASRWAIWRPLRPASTSSLVVPDSIKVQLPALPLPKIVMCIPTTAILHRARPDSSFLQTERGNLWPLLVTGGEYSEAGFARRDQGTKMAGPGLHQVQRLSLQQILAPQLQQS